MSTPLEFLVTENMTLKQQMMQMMQQMGQLNMHNQFLQGQLAAASKVVDVAASKVVDAPKVDAAAAEVVVDAAAEVPTAAEVPAAAAAAPVVAMEAAAGGGGASAVAAAAGGGGSSASVCSSKSPFNPVFQTWCDWAGKCKGKGTWCKKAHKAVEQEWATTPMKNRCTIGDWNNPDCIKWCPDLSCKKVHHPSTDRTPIRCPFQKEGQTCYSTSCTRNLHEGAEGYKAAKKLSEFQAHKAKVSKP
jgi:hypothetical protein